MGFNSFQGYNVSVFRFMGGHGEQLTLDFGCTILVSQLFSWDHWSCSNSNSNFKLKTSISGSRSFHLDGCISTEHAHPSYSHTTFQMPLKHWVKFEFKNYPQILHPYVVSLLRLEPKDVWLETRTMEPTNMWLETRTMPIGRIHDEFCCKRLLKFMPKLGYYVIQNEKVRVRN